MSGTTVTIGKWSQHIQASHLAGFPGWEWFQYSHWRFIAQLVIVAGRTHLGKFLNGLSQALKMKIFLDHCQGFQKPQVHPSHLIALFEDS